MQERREPFLPVVWQSGPRSRLARPCRLQPPQLPLHSPPLQKRPFQRPRPLSRFNPLPGQLAPAAPPSGQQQAGGKLHGVVKSGNIPLPGVTVTAQNTLTGKRYSTTTDITGAWTLNIPQNGRYVVRTQFAAFAQGSQEAVLNATSHDQMVNFELILASRAAEQEQQQARQTAPAGQCGEQAIRQLAGNGPRT